MQDISIGLDPEEGILGGGYMELGMFGVGKEGVRPPDLLQHLVADTQLILNISTELQPRVPPVLPEVEVHCEVLKM